MRCKAAFRALSILLLAVSGLDGKKVLALEPSLLPGVIGTDDRVEVDSRSKPWNAVGQVNVSGYRRRGACTGTLIAPGLVVTAAHCVFNTRTRKSWPAHQVHFVIGVGSKGARAYSKAACVKIAEGYKVTKAGRIVDLKNDFAVIILKKRLSRSTTMAVQKRPVALGTALAYGGYQRDRRQRILADKSCQLLRKSTGLWFSDCDALKGGSGGPVFVLGTAGWRIGAVMVAVVAKKYSISVPVSRFAKMMTNARCPDPS